MFVAVGGNPALVATSVDGLDWDVHPVPYCGRLRDVCKTANGYCAVGQGGAVAHSTDGITWNGSSIENATEIFAVSECGRGAFAVGYRRTFSTSDGCSWEVLRDDLSCFAFDMIPVLGEYLMVGQSISTLDHTTMWTTENGRELTPVEVMTNDRLRAVAYSAETRCIVAVGEDGVILRNQLVEVE